MPKLYILNGPNAGEYVTSTEGAEKHIKLYSKGAKPPDWAPGDTLPAPVLTEYELNYIQRGYGPRCWFYCTVDSVSTFAAASDETLAAAYQTAKDADTFMEFVGLPRIH